jgi:hypothetical protein
MTVSFFASAEDLFFKPQKYDIQLYLAIFINYNALANDLIIKKNVCRISL